MKLNCLLKVKAMTGLLLLAHAALPQTRQQYKYISLEKATVDGDGNLYDNGKTYGLTVKGDYNIPRISSSESYKGFRSLLFEIPPTQPKQDSDDPTTDKCQYMITGGEEGLTFGKVACFGFAFKLAPDTDIPLQRTQLFQMWQGSKTSPPLAIRLAGVNNSSQIELNLEIRNNTTTGRDDKGKTIYKKIIERDKWYSVVLRVDLRRVIDKEDGLVQLWINKAQVLDWSGRVGYSDGVISTDQNGDHILDERDGTIPNTTLSF